MPFPINQNQPQFVPQQRTQGNFQQALQRLGPPPHANQGQQQGQGLAGPGQDAMISFSPEAMEELAQSQTQAQGMQPPSGPSPDQLESQIQSGDLQGALNTIAQLDANRPNQGADPNAQLKSQLKAKLQQGDQQGAEATLEQIKANRPSGPPPQH